MAPKKDPSQLSTNPKTVRELQRRQNKTGFAAEIMKAKRNDDAAILYAKKQLKLTPAWINATPEDQVQQLTDCTKTVTTNR